MPSRRRVLAAAAVGVASLAGCADIDGRSDRTDRPTATPTRTRTAEDARTAAEPSAEGGTDESGGSDDAAPWHEAANEPDYDKRLRLDNRDDETHEVRVVVRPPDGEASGDEPLFDESVAVPPEATTVAYAFETLADRYDGVREFPVRAELGDAAATLTVVTSECHGHFEVVVNENAGTLDATYAAC
ncbi:hypothetical protein GCM10027435_18900 [Haloparvum alkalitolerans]|uniref:hypothetical protein n=1 Tax=Haloparvum alkalitolerans TaxID=1042953 RepID=UPI003CE67893